MPVAIGTSTAVTNSAGEFTLSGIPANPGPISAGGSVGTGQGRLDLTAPVAQLLGHALYANANNVIAAPLILPKVNWSSAIELQPDDGGLDRRHHHAGDAGLAIPDAGQHRGVGHRPPEQYRSPSCPPRSPPSTCRRTSAASVLLLQHRRNEPVRPRCN